MKTAHWNSLDTLGEAGLKCTLFSRHSHQYLSLFASVKLLSHLELMHYMSRAIFICGLPVMNTRWYTWWSHGLIVRGVIEVFKIVSLTHLPGQRDDIHQIQWIITEALQATERLISEHPARTQCKLIVCFPSRCLDVFVTFCPHSFSCPHLLVCVNEQFPFLQQWIKKQKHLHSAF